MTISTHTKVAKQRCPFIVVGCWTESVLSVRYCDYCLRFADQSHPLPTHDGTMILHLSVSPNFERCFAGELVPNAILFDMDVTKRQSKGNLLVASDRPSASLLLLYSAS